MPYKWRCTNCGAIIIGKEEPVTFSICRDASGKKYRNHSWQRGAYVEGKGTFDCFITTAVCQTLGTPDDCKELTMIRKFRDDRLKTSMEDGELLVKEYYRIGPKIVNAIEKDAYASNIYTGLWNNHIKPCCEQIEQQNWEQVKLIYIKMVKELCEKYNVAVDPTISRKYFL